MQRSSPNTLAAALAVVLLAAFAAPAFAADCSATADEVNARCYPSLQAAADAAIASDRPLLLPRGTYQGPLTIDYSAHAGTGFELISRGATILGGLAVHCSSDCFYFHQEGTLFVSGQSSDPLFTLGKPDFSDPQNTIKIDHLVVNNGGSGSACQFNYVLDADVFAVCDSAGWAGMDVRQLQFSTVKGAASGSQGYAIALRDGYIFSNTFSLDLEASPICKLFTDPQISNNTWLSTYDACPEGSNVLSHSALTGNTVIGGMVIWLKQLWID
jgi:hypothetical protein